MPHHQEWYANVAYRRYWEHYQYAMEWIRRHKQAYWKAKAKAEEFENRTLSQLLTNYFSYNNQQIQRFPQSHIRQSGFHYSDERRHNESRQYQYDEEDAKDITNTEEPVFEMEITEEMLNFLEKSERHREELRE